MTELDKLEEKSISIIREAMAQFKNPAVLWSMGKDSTAVLWLVRKALFGKMPAVVHLDTGRKFPKMYGFRDRLAKEWGMNLVVAKNEDAISSGISEKEKLKCCTELKTNALKQTIKKNNFDALFLAIRRDEHGIRAKERYVSPRDQKFQWNYKDQPAEMWDMFKGVFEDGKHFRVHPILDWTELDVWEYMEKEGIPVNELYFAKDGKRYRSLGCVPCTDPIDSDADTIDKIIAELKSTKAGERDGRAQDKEKHMMQKLRALGYM